MLPEYDVSSDDVAWLVDEVLTKDVFSLDIGVVCGRVVLDKEDVRFVYFLMAVGDIEDSYVDPCKL